MLSTKGFKKRFHMLNILAKLETVEKIRLYFDHGIMPSGSIMSEYEKHEIQRLLTWCDINIFFDATPSKWEQPKY